MENIILYAKAIVMGLCIFLPATFFGYLLSWRTLSAKFKQKVLIFVFIWAGLLVLLYFLVRFKLFAIILTASIVFSGLLIIVRKLSR
jgi:hypothetical protein